MRAAISAEFRGAGAVVCLATEDCPELVEEHFEIFDTRTVANASAARLNEALHISAYAVTQIVLSAKLAEAEASDGAESAAAAATCGN